MLEQALASPCTPERPRRWVAAKLSLALSEEVAVRLDASVPHDEESLALSLPPRDFVLSGRSAAPRSLELVARCQL